MIVSAIVWYLGESEVLYVHIGDARNSLVRAAHDWEQITKDDPQNRVPKKQREFNN